MPRCHMDVEAQQAHTRCHGRVHLVQIRCELLQQSAGRDKVSLVCMKHCLQVRRQMSGCCLQVAAEHARMHERPRLIVGQRCWVSLIC